MQDKSLDRQDNSLNLNDKINCVKKKKKCVFAQPEGNRQSLDTEG